MSSRQFGSRRFEYLNTAFVGSHARKVIFSSITRDLRQFATRTGFHYFSRFLRVAYRDTQVETMGKRVFDQWMFNGCNEKSPSRTEMPTAGLDGFSLSLLA